VPARNDPDPPPDVTIGAMSAEERLVKSLGWILLLSFFGTPVIILWTVGPKAPVAMLVGPSLLVSIVMSGWCLTLQRRQRGALERAGFRVCLKCRYSLADLPDVGTCPECGTQFTLEQVQRSWSWTYSKH
jgi:hypothetical protein